jgi:uncharacterized protein YutE (UPF0331/DUF86 family)
MTSAPIRAAIVTEKLSYIREMVEALRNLPLSSQDDFSSDVRNAAAAESYLRRALEGLFDLGRHMLTKGFAVAPTEYKEIAAILTRKGILSKEHGRILREMAGYRNRMVHFYNEIGEEELYHICRDELTDIEAIADALTTWLREHPHKVDAFV